MTNEELVMLRDLCADLIDTRHESCKVSAELAAKSDVNERQDKEYSSLCLECNRLREREAEALNANEDLKARCADLMSERDETRRKLGALTLCVGFDEAYFKKRPTRALNDLRNAVKKCIADNHIVLTEGGMAK